jgi:hypothetical protein
MKPSQILNPIQTARFWTWLNDGWVKISVPIDKPMTWGKSWNNGEGYSCEHNTWEWDGSHLTENSGYSGTDCDGRHSSQSNRFVEPERIKSVQCFAWWDNEKFPILGMFMPDWTEGKRSQRDYSAEAAGY